MGQVFQARHRHMQRTVALKLIRKEKLANEDAVKRFYQEVQAAAQLHHPNIVVAYDAGPAGTAHYFAMEYVEGTDLARLVRESGPLPAGLACEYVRQAALGLQHAYERGLVHRDIKPANLLVGRDAGGFALVKVLDMGLARLQVPGGGNEKALTQTGQVMGTPDYLAPEQAMDARLADVRSDLYSLGCTLYYLLTGRAPFTGESLAQVLLKHQMAEVEAPPGGWGQVPPAVQAVLRKLLAKKPESRFQTPQELVRALEPLCGDTESAPLMVQAVEAEAGADSVWPTLTGDEGVNARLPKSRGRAGDSTERLLSKGPGGQATPNNRRTVLLIAGGVGLGGLLLGAALAAVLVAGWSKPPAEPAVALVQQPEKSPPPPKADPAPTTPAPQTTPPEPAASTATEADTNPPPPPKVRRTPPQTSVPAPERVRPPPPPPPVAPAVKPTVRPARPQPRVVSEDEVQAAPVLKPTRRINPGGGNQPVRVAISPDGHYGHYQGQTSVLLDLRSGKEVGYFPPGGRRANVLEFSPNGRQVVSASQSSQDHTLTLWSVPSQKAVRAFKNDHHVQAVAFSPDGKRLAGGHGQIDSPAPGQIVKKDCGVTVWDVGTGNALHTWEWPGEQVNRVAFSPDGDRVYAKRWVDSDGAIGVFEVSSGTELPKFAGPQGAVFTQGLLVTRDGTGLIVGTFNGPALWDLQREAEVRQFPYPRPCMGVTLCGPAFVLTGGGQQVPGKLEWTNNDIYVWELSTGKLVRRLQGHARAVSSLAASADGKRILSGGSDGSVYLWELPAEMRSRADAN
jgi:serine/threonine protein kinase